MNDGMLNEIGATFAYGAVGIALMAVGYLAVELMTPGRLSKQIWTDGNKGAALLLAVKLFSVGVIVTTAIVTSDDDLGAGLIDTAVFGGIGILLMVDRVPAAGRDDPRQARRDARGRGRRRHQDPPRGLGCGRRRPGPRRDRRRGGLLRRAA